MRYMKPIAATLALAIGASTLVGTAEAGHRHHHHHGDAAGLAAAGIFGLAAGALRRKRPRAGRAITTTTGLCAVSSAASVYEEATPVYYNRTAPPWSRAWYDWCSQFPSFDPQTGYLPTGPMALITSAAESRRTNLLPNEAKRPVSRRPFSFCAQLSRSITYDRSLR